MQEFQYNQVCILEEKCIFIDGVPRIIPSRFSPPKKNVPNSVCFYFCLFVSFVGGEGSAETGQKETSTCDICQFGAECDVDAEDVW